MWTASFWKETAERAVKSFAQGVAGLIAVDGMGVMDVDWLQVFSVAGLLAILSLATSIASANTGPKGTPRLTQ